MPAAPGSAIEASDLVLDLGDGPARHRVLDGVSLGVAPGEKVVLVGASGSGKSSLLRCLNGLERPSRGRVRVLGHDLWADRAGLAAARRRTGTIFQAFNLFTMRTALDNVAVGLVELKAMSWTQAREAAEAQLARVGVAELADRYPFELSGGQQQRVAIARALATRPDVLLLDEPTSALDPELVRGVLDVIERVVRSEGLTTVCVTHEVGFARRLADRVVVLAGGRVVADGTPDAVLPPRGSARAEALGGGVA